MSRNLSGSRRKFAAKTDFFCWCIWVLATLMFVGADEVSQKLGARSRVQVLETVDATLMPESLFSGKTLQSASDVRDLLNATGFHPNRVLFSFETIAERATGLIPRLDPLNGFSVYKGAFNVTDYHYWASVAFTGVWGYSLAAVCLAYGLIHSFLLLCTCLCGCCKLRPQKDQLKTLQVSAVCFFALIAMMGAFIIFVGNVKLGAQLQETTNVIVGTINDVLRQINQILIFIRRATQPIASQEIQDEVIFACNMMNDTAHEVDQFVQDRRQWLYKIFGEVKLALTVTATIVVSTLVAGVGATCYRHRVFILSLFFFMVLLLFCTWMLAGISFVLSNVASDACTAMREYEVDPLNSHLAKLLPCLDQAFAEATLIGARSSIKALINQTNTVIDMVNEKEEENAQKNNETHPRLTLEYVCDPYGPAPLYDVQNCSTNVNDFRDFAKDYANYRCINDSLDYCFDMDTPIPNTAFIELSIAMNASRDVYNTLPTLVKIMTCDFVKAAFQVLIVEHCTPLRYSLYLLWIGFILAALAMMPLEVIWPIIYNCLPNGNNRIAPGKP